MKNLIATVLVCLFAGAPLAASATSPFDGVGLHFFHNYNPVTKSYTGETYSYLAAPVSAEILLDTTSAVCFFGQGEKAAELVKSMIAIYNRSAEFPLVLDYFSMSHAADYKLTQIQFGVSQKTRVEKADYSWPRIRRCVR